MITEVAHSQNGRVLGHLAEDCILGTDLVIRAVVGVDIDYKNKRAVFSVWRAKEQSSGADKFWVVEYTVTKQVSLAESTIWQRLTYRRYCEIRMANQTQTKPSVYDCT